MSFYDVIVDFVVYIHATDLVLRGIDFDIPMSENSTKLELINWL